MSTRILVVDDEPELVQNLHYRLKKEGFIVDTALNGAAALMQADRSPRPDLVLLDLMLPDIKGTEVLQRLRARETTAHIPVIMVTALGEELDRVLGFELGVDDYVVKPYSTRELLLRVRAVLRRSQEHTPAKRQLTVGSLEIDMDAYDAKLDGRSISLTALELRLLYALISRRGVVQSRETLLENVWEYQAGVNSRTVDTHVTRLREKLGHASPLIETVRGVGYRFKIESES
jgi:two-component system phosphate regulon response regulator PhoB